MKEINKLYLQTFGMIAGEIRLLSKHFKKYNKRLKMILEQQNYYASKIEENQRKITRELDLRLTAHNTAQEKLFRSYYNSYADQMNHGLTILNRLINENKKEKPLKKKMIAKNKRKTKK